LNAAEADRPQAGSDAAKDGDELNSVVALNAFGDRFDDLVRLRV
jgi:hypothetical protein